MSDQAKVTMMLCEGLEPAEQEKVERLDCPISERFIRAGLVARICQGNGRGHERVLTFSGPAGVVASVRAEDFLSATDHEAVALITLSAS